MSAQQHSGNFLVSSLSEASCSVLEWVTLGTHQIVAAPGEEPSHVLFPVGCSIALLLPLVDGSTGLAALVGNEGIVGVESFLGSGSRVTNAIAMVQSDGPAWRLPLGQFEYEVANNFALQQRLTRYTLALVSQMARTAACVRQHPVEQQVARWLLQSWDRTRLRVLPLDSEGVATLLALDRDVASAALAGIERSGGIVCEASHLTLWNRAALEATACPCYGAMRESELRAIMSDVPLGRAPSHQHDSNLERLAS